MKNPLPAKLRALFAASENRDSPWGERSSYERFAIPYTFKPQLSLAEAAISACGAFLRIVFGSILFAVWGAYILLAWTSIHNMVLRCAAVLALVVSLGVVMAALMLAIAAVVRRMWPQGGNPS